MKRRHFVATAGAVFAGATAGCSGGGGPDDGTTTPTSEPEDETPTATVRETPTPVGFQGAEDPFEMTTDTGGTGYTATGTATLGHQRYAHLELSPPARFHIEGFVESRGPPFDFLAIHDGQLGRYQHGHEVEVVSELSGLGTTRTTFDVELEPALYRLVFDNTVMGEADPAPEVVADFEWTVQPA